jgi:hypothetical protein
MAKIVENVVQIKFSRIVRENDADRQDIATADIRAALEQVAQELVGDSVIVEVDPAQ